MILPFLFLACTTPADYCETILREASKTEKMMLQVSEHILKKDFEKAKLAFDEAKEEARRIIKHAQDEALLEQKRAMDDVKKEIITVAALMAEKIVSASIDAKVQDTLLEETLKEMGDSTWLS